MNARDTLRPGESLPTLAARLLGDPLRWRELVDLNGLRPPYLSPAGGPGVLKPGDDVIYPATPGSPPPRNLAQLEAETYRRDLEEVKGDLVLSHGDLATTAGLPNLRAALLTRLRVSIGAHPFHPGYGSRLKNHLGAVADHARLSILLDDVIRAALQDPRVQGASGEAVWESGVLNAVIQITPIPPGTPFELTLPLRQ